MKVMIKNTNKFKRQITVIERLLRKATVTFSKKGLIIQHMDTANVSHIRYVLGSEEIVFSGEKTTVVIEDLEKIKDYLKTTKNRDTIIFKTEISDGKDSESLREKLFLEIKRDDGSELRYRIELDPYENHSELKIDGYDFKSEIVMGSVSFKKTIFQFNKLSDATIFRTKNSIFEMFVEIDGEHVAGCKVSKGVNGGKGEVVSKYSLDYLKKMSYSSIISGDVSLSFSTDYPLKLLYDGDGCSVRFMLAPRVR